MDSPAKEAQAIIDELPVETAGGADMIDRVMELYFTSDGRRTAADTDAFGVVLERMVYSADTEKRAEIANQLASSKDAPVRLMRRLAFDCITVARPVLQYSGCLSESDLVTLAMKLDQDYLAAIAHRRRLSPQVTDILVERGNPDVLVTVAQNSSASFTGAALQRLSEMAEDDPELRFTLGLRAELNPSLFDRFKSFVTDQLFVPVDEERPEGRAAAADGPDESEAELQAGEDGEAAGEGPDAPTPGEEGEPKPIYDPIRDSYASEKNLVKLAKAEMLNETVTCMAKLTGMDGAMIEHCLLRAELSALMVLCKANGYGNTTFTVLLKLRQKHSDDPGSIDIKSMLYRYEAMQSHTAKRIIQYANKKKK